MRETPQKLVEWVLSPEHDASFYRTKYTTSADFNSIPTLTKSELTQTPIRKRLYRHDGLLMKLPEIQPTPYFVARGTEDIAAEPLDFFSERPLVAFKNIGEHLQWGIWCKEHCMLPLMADGNTQVNLITAKKYACDALLCDVDFLTSHGEVFAQTLSDTLKEVVVIDSANFDTVPKALKHLISWEVLALPESGIIAKRRCGKREWELAGTVYAEVMREELIITPCIKLPTPLIRYETGFRAASLSKNSVELYGI